MYTNQIWETDLTKEEELARGKKCTKRKSEVREAPEEEREVKSILLKKSKNSKLA